MRRIRGTIALAVILLGLAPAGAVDTHVDIQDFAFVPQTVTIVAGDTVDWTNRDDVAHTVTSDSGGQFDSGVLMLNDTFSVLFSVPGSYAYHCAIHPSMTGTVIVNSPVGASPSSVNFGTILVDTTSPPQVITVANDGGSPSTIGSVGLDGTNPDQYLLQNDQCSGLTLDPGGSCTVEVAFSPTILGSPLTASLQIPNDAPGSPATVSLTGNSVSELVPGLSLSGDLDFTFVRVGATSDPLSVTLTSNGVIRLHVVSVGVAGANAGDFQITSDGCSGGAFDPGQTCEIAVVMTPSEGGPRVASLEVVSDAPSSPDAVGLSGTGDGQAPSSAFSSGNPTVLGAGTSALFGATTDDRSGVAGVRIDYGLPAVGTLVSVPATITCATPVMCTWTAEMPATPGVYAATATGVDAVGNVETSGPSILVVVL